MTPENVLASLCYVRRDDETLMLHRVTKEDDIHEGKWNGLGGKFEAGESPEECVRREVREEADLSLNSVHLHGVLTFPTFDGERDWYVFVFSSADYEGTPPDSSREGELEWIPDEDLLDLNLWEGDEYFLRWMQDDPFFSGKFTYKEGALADHEVTFHPTRRTFDLTAGT
jgi:8-oxo-dGTP diphosphatase